MFSLPMQVDFKTQMVKAPSFDDVCIDCMFKLYLSLIMTCDHDVVAIPDGEQMVHGRDVFGFVEKAEVKPVPSPQRVSVGSSGEDGIQWIFVYK